MIEAYIYSGECELHVSYDESADIDGTFDAFCHDTQKMIRVNGWLISEIEPIQ